MIKKTGAVLLSLLLTILSAGPECYQALAGELGARSPAGRLSLSRPAERPQPKKLPLAGRAAGLHLPFSSPRRGMGPAAESAPPNPDAAGPASAGAGSGNRNAGLKRLMEDLSGPTALGRVAKQAPEEASREAALEDFSREVGEGVVTRASEASVAGRQSPARARLGKAALGAPLAVIGLSLPAAAAADKAAPHMPAIPAVAAGAAAVAAKAVLAGGLLYLGALAAVKASGRNITERRFRDFIQAESSSGRLNPELASRIRLLHRYSPRGRFKLYYWAGGALYIRPGLSAWPFLFRRVASYAGRSLKTQLARGPPNPPASNLELSADRTGLSFSDVEPYDILVSRSAGAELKDPAVYQRLGDGKEPSLAVEDLSAALADKNNARRFGAVVLDKPFEYLPQPDTGEWRILTRTLNQLHGQWLTATGRSPEGKDLSALGHGPRRENFARLARLLGGGKARTQEEYEKQLRDFWHQIVASRLRGMALSRLIEGLYASMQDKGLAFISFAPDDPSLPFFEKFLMFWEAEDGGEFRAVRDPLPNGGFILALRKIEPRVGLWLKPPPGFTLEESVPDANVSPEKRRRAWELVEKAGFADHIAEFKGRGVEIEQIIGKKAGSELIYITVPRRHAEYVRSFVAASSIRVRHSEAAFEPEMLEAPALQGVSPLRALGLNGAGGLMGVIDTGLDLRTGHFDPETTRLKQMVRYGWKDPGEHGTHVGGIMHSRDPLFGGIARDARLIVYKVFGDGEGAADGPIVGGLVHFFELLGDIVNASLGMKGNPASHLAQTFSRLADQRNAKGEKLMIVASAGNSGPMEYPLASLSQPAVGDNVTSVAAVAKSLDDGEPEMPYYTMGGPARDPRYSVERLRIKPDVSGIGGDGPDPPNVEGGVVSAKSQDAPPRPSDSPNGRETGMSGTSMASPMVAAIMMLVKTAMRWARKLCARAFEFCWDNLPLSVRAIVMSTAADLRVPVWIQGAGLADAWKAVALVAYAVPQAAVLSAWGRLARLWGARAGGPLDWVERLKNVMDLEDRIFEPVKKSDEELQEAEGEEEQAQPGPAAPQAPDNAQVAEAKREIFRRRARAALPYLMRRLDSRTEPSWLVRRQAALVLLNLRLPESAKALADAAIQDPEPRVQQMAFLALAKAPIHSQDFFVRPAVLSKRWDVGIYAAYALARHGDAFGVARIVQETKSGDKKARYSSVWLLGQLKDKATSAEAEVLSEKAKQVSERANIRHLAVAALANIALANPQAISAQVLSDLLDASGPDSFALTSTILKFFLAALRSPVIRARFQESSLKPKLVLFILNNRGAVQKPGRLGNLVEIMSRVIGLPLDVPTPVPDPSGFGVPGVDADMGPLDVIVELPKGRRLSGYWDAKSAGDAASALGQAGLQARELDIFEATLKAAMPVSNALWLAVPEHKMFAFAHQMRRRGFQVRLSAPDYSMTARAKPPKSGLYFQVDRPESWPALGDESDLSLVNLDSAKGASEAKVMGALEYLYSRIGDPLKKPTVVVVGLGAAPAKERSPLSRLLDRLMLRNVGVVVPAGNDGPAEAALSSPADAELAVTVAASRDDNGDLEWYSHRSPKGGVGITWARATGAGAYGTGAAAERTGEDLAALARRMAEARGGTLPDGYFLYLTGLVKQTLTPMPANGPHEVGGGLFDDAQKAAERLEARLKYPGQMEAEAAALAKAARERVGEPQAPPTKSAPPNWRQKAALAINRIYDRPLGSQALTDILGDAASRRTKAFEFLKDKYHDKDGQALYRARGAGLSGFIYSKLEMERNLGEDETLADWDHYFPYLNDLLAPYAGAAEIRRRLEEIHSGAGALKAKNERLNAYLVETFNALSKRFVELNPSKAGPKNVYMILSRAYNRLKPGKNFLDSIDDGEIARIKEASGANVLWLLDIWESGQVNKVWKLDNPYAVRRYHVKPELGGDEALERLIKRLEKAGMILCVDQVPNHASIDSDEEKELPQNFIHIVPPQPEAGEDEQAYQRRVLSQVPQSEKGVFSPVYYAVKTKKYPGHEGQDLWILVHHPWSWDGKWFDMIQRDYTRPSARKWVIDDVVRLVKMGVRMFRRDMVSYVVNKEYYAHWSGLLRWEADQSQGWAKDEIQKFVAGFNERRAALGGKEILEEMVDAAHAVNPQVIFADEGYQFMTELSAAKTDLLYNKTDLYDSLVDAVSNGNTSRLRASLRNLAYRTWQRGGAAFLNIFVTHDGGEGNPVDKFKGAFGAVAMTALLQSANLFYCGMELGLGQAAMLMGDLDKSTDRSKAIPFDVEVLIDWAKKDPRNAGLVADIVRFRQKFKDVVDRGALDVLEPADDNPIAAWTQSLKDPATGAQKTILAAANYSGERRWGKFLFKKPVLAAWGAFQPRADRQYILKDYNDLDRDGRPHIYPARAGQELLDGISIGLDAGAFQLFELEEVNPNAPRTGPPLAAGVHVNPAVAESAPTEARSPAPGTEPGGQVAIQDAAPSAASKVVPKPSSWDVWTQRLNNSSLFAYFFLQIPQIVMNFRNLHAGHPEMLQNLPWLGYSFGTMADLLILPYFLSINESAQARVQSFGVIANAIVMSQLAAAHFMPPLAAAFVIPGALAGMALSYLNKNGKVNEKLWQFWIKSAGLFGLVMSVPALLDTFGLARSHWPAMAGLGTWAALLALDYLGRLPGAFRRSWEKVSAWTATWLYMFGPVAGLASAFAHPQSIPGTSVTSGLLAMAGALLMFPRSIFAKDKIWFIGVAWSIAVGGWLGFFTRWYFNAWSGLNLVALTGVVLAYVGFVLKRNAPDESSLWESLRFLLPKRFNNKADQKKL